MTIYDIAIVGGGPAGASGAIYAARKRLKSIVLTKDFGGQSTSSGQIENWLGTINMSGIELGKMIKGHVEHYRGDCLEIKEGKYVQSIVKDGDGNFLITTEEGKEYLARTVLICSGAKRRKLDPSIPGAEEFEHKGIVYCATCDAPMFSDQDVVVVGGGNAAFETAIQLLSYAKSVTVMTRGPEFRADSILMESFFNDPKAKGINSTEIKEIEGEIMVKGLVYKDRITEKEHDLSVTGVFVEIGTVPANGFVKDLIELDEIGSIVIDHRNQRTSLEGVWAAGDCTNSLYKQNIIAAGDGANALEDIYRYLKSSK